MTKPTITIHDLEKDQLITREMTDEEAAQYALDVQAVEAEIAAIAAKEALRQSRREKLLALGLTEEELDA